MGSLIVWKLTLGRRLGSSVGRLNGSQLKLYRAGTQHGRIIESAHRLTDP